MYNIVRSGVFSFLFNNVIDVVSCHSWQRSLVSLGCETLSCVGELNKAVTNGMNTSLVSYPFLWISP